MPDDTLEVSRRRVLSGLITIGGASVATGVGTMAYFSDSEESTGNTVTTGTLRLGFDSDGEFEFGTALAPTETSTESVTLVNSGTITGSLDVDVDYSEYDASDAPDPDMTANDVAESIEVVILDYGENNLLAGQGLPSNPTLHDLAENPHGDDESTENDLINLADPGDGTDFTVELRLKNVSDDFQGDGVDVTFTFYLNQTDDQ